MLGSGFLTAAIGEPLFTLGVPVRPAGLGDPEAARPGDSCKTETRARLWSQTNSVVCLSRRKRVQYKENGINLTVTNISQSRDVKTLTVAPLVGVAGCFANKDCREKKLNGLIQTWFTISTIGSYVHTNGKKWLINFGLSGNLILNIFIPFLSLICKINYNIIFRCP